MSESTAAKKIPAKQRVANRMLPAYCRCRGGGSGGGCVRTGAGTGRAGEELPARRQNDRVHHTLTSCVQLYNLIISLLLATIREIKR